MPLSVIEPTMVGPGEKLFQNKDSQRLENATFILVFSYAVFHKRAILFIS